MNSTGRRGTILIVASSFGLTLGTALGFSALMPDTGTSDREVMLLMTAALFVVGVPALVLGLLRRADSFRDSCPAAN